jgi:pimeloyl-ACP methyl ester carboxylesterase
MDFEEIDSAAARGRWPARHRRVSLEQPGMHLSVWDRGQAKDQARDPTRDGCILLHGFGDGAYVWDPFMASAALGRRAIAIDLRGHGDSTWDPAGRYGVEQHATDVLQIIDALELRKYVIVGHSLGGAVAIRLAARRPEAVDSLLIVDYGPNLNPEGAARVRSDFRESQRVWTSVAQYAEWLCEHRPLARRSALLEIAASALRPQSDGSFRLKADPALDLIVDDVEAQSAEVWGLLRSITTPITVIRGLGSAVLSPNVVREMTRVLPNVRAVTVSNAGHAVMSDNPEEFAKVLDAFLAEASSLETARRHSHLQSISNKRGS